MRRVCIGLLLVLLVTVGGSCAEEPSPSPTVYSVLWVTVPIEVFSRTPHTNELMHAVVGEELTLTLGSNPTTGFRWSEFAEISDQTVVQQISHEFMGPGIDEPPGTPGEEVWVFKALKKGTTTILLEYSRPWVEAEIGYWTVTVTVTVRER